MIALVTGGCGFIGSQIVSELQDIADEIRIIDDMSLGKMENVENMNCDLHIGSILDKALLQKVMKGVTHVFHCAALISVADSADNIQEYENVNTIGTINVLEAAANAKVESFVFSSSCSVYGEDDIILRNESSSTNPVSPYAWTKVHGEHYCKYFHEIYNLNTVVLRYFNVYGPKQDPNKNYAAAVPIFLKLGMAKKPITIYGDGHQSRDFVHVSDIARANIHAAVNGLSGTYNVGSGDSTSIINLASNILVLTENILNPSNIKHELPRSGDLRFIECDNTRLLQSGFKFKYNLKSGLKQMLTELNKL